MPEEMENKKKEKIVFYRFFILEIIFCLFIFVLGIVIAERFYRFASINQIEIPELSVGQFLAYFLATTAFILILVFVPRIRKTKARIYKFLFLFAGAYGSLIVFSSFFNGIISLALTFALILWWLGSQNLLSHNLLMGLGLAGLSSALGLSFKPQILLFVLAILSIYDFIAVYKTKHMIRMAKSMMESGVIMGLIIPNRIEGLMDKTKKIKLGGRHIILGGGDIALPLIFSVSLIPQGIICSIIVAAFSLLGISLTLLALSLQKKRRPIPALPSIALFSIIGYLITFFL